MVSPIRMYETSNSCFLLGTFFMFIMFRRRSKFKLFCSGNIRNPNEKMRLVVTVFVGIVLGFFLGVSFPTLYLTKVHGFSFVCLCILIHLLLNPDHIKSDMDLLLCLNLVDESSIQPFSFHWSFVHRGQVLRVFNPSTIECLVFFEGQHRQLRKICI